MSFARELAENRCHRRAVNELALRVGYRPLSVRLHDLDKVVMSLVLPHDVVSWLHRKFSLHHPGNIWGCCDIRHAVLDWESARFTKPDKPLTARQTAVKYYPAVQDSALLVCDKWGI